jgi:hypothetical protein
MERSLPSFIIGTPAYGEMFYTPYVQSLFRLTRAFDQRNFSSEFCSVSYSDIADSRNIILTYWYEKTDASHLLFVDADMGFDPDLIFDMLAFDKPVIGTVYPKKTVDLNRISKLTSTGQQADQAIANSHDFVVRRPIASSYRDGFIQVEGCGTGIFLLKRSCIDVMLKKMPEIDDDQTKQFIGRIPDLKLGNGEKAKQPFKRFIRAFDFIHVDGQRLTEDYSFCHRWKNQCGGEVWASVNHEITHIGVNRFRARYSDAKGPRTRVVQLPLTKLHRNSPKATD